MSKGEETRHRVLEQAGALLNRSGYLATPLSAILETVGLQKGGFYNHFPSKEALALEAFQTNAGALGIHLGTLARGEGDPAEVLWSLLEASLDVASGRVVPGGCPILNAGTEADDCHEPLRQAASVSLEALRRLFLIPLNRLGQTGRLRPGTDTEALSWLLVAVTEGGILTSKVTGDARGQRAALGALRTLVEGLLS